ncbi:hypothetical protein PPOP_2371 [Paenibacillus popilliae ATCC 14706]|uniref:Uncharacterized protein n=1 Tax=Paenibacillus popilliae ATCC 14706 TaxID=1212764 RepID=M9M698_PAEPP|nr:hypothetical protein PPOP_2371 [Paenibacillus popilliae ATCC 14706]
MVESKKSKKQLYLGEILIANESQSTTKTKNIFECVLMERDPCETSDEEPCA